MLITLRIFFPAFPLSVTFNILFKNAKNLQKAVFFGGVFRVCFLVFVACFGCCLVVCLVVFQHLLGKLDPDASPRIKSFLILSVGIFVFAFGVFDCFEERGKSVVCFGLFVFAGIGFVGAALFPFVVFCVFLLLWDAE